MKNYFETKMRDLKLQLEALELLRPEIDTVEDIDHNLKVLRIIEKLNPSYYGPWVKSLETLRSAKTK